MSFREESNALEIASLRDGCSLVLIECKLVSVCGTAVGRTAVRRVTRNWIASGRRVEIPVAIRIDIHIQILFCEHDAWLRPAKIAKKSVIGFALMQDVEIVRVPQDSKAIAFVIECLENGWPWTRQSPKSASAPSHSPGLITPSATIVLVVKLTL